MTWMEPAGERLRGSRGDGRIHLGIECKNVTTLDTLVLDELRRGPMRAQYVAGQSAHLR